ncbi:hypothetical protein [Halogeometricum sp. CBA1124]|uniref:hypothetical protein n=1 Tax=Halogeometricum sp. CBA1124 TaxID=2668071 RepID=UPI00142B32C9|nr:hypothetical protein [Halogeometricum sp. CBA1124]MUV58275.1 hypothetical protein [Halogeometricum sp. CBA1124]
MNEVPTIVGWPSVGPPDRQALRAIDRFLSTMANIDRTEFHPDSFHPQLLKAWPTPSPDSSGTTRLDIHWFTTGEFSVTYYQADECVDQRVGRWDRHTGSRGTRCHFHHLSTTGNIETVDFDEINPLGVLRTILASLPRA